MNRLLVWAQQPTSVTGLAALFGTFSAVMTHQLSWAQAFPLLAGALASIAMPDNTRAKGDAEALVRDITTPRLAPEPNPRPDQAAGTGPS
jgi:hypothetical protein